MILPMASATYFHVDDPPSLTKLASCGGCGAKLTARELLPLLDELHLDADPRLLAGHGAGDDAAVFALSDGLALVQTTDFFPPLVDDPYDFGRIAAANALSDVYATGGTPLTAMNLVAFPLRQLGQSVLDEILRGGRDIVQSVGATVVGGHSIHDSEPKYGLAVTGTVDRERLKTNAGGRAGDVLTLSKPLGTGVIVTACMRESISEDLLAQAVDVMVDLNDEAASDAIAAGAHAMTDVTGYGLLGQLHTLCRASGLAAEINAALVPAVGGARELLEQELGLSSGTRENRAWAAGFAEIHRGVPSWRAWLLADATTSGGLLAAVPASRADQLGAATFGRLCDGPPGTITVT